MTSIFTLGYKKVGGVFFRFFTALRTPVYLFLSVLAFLTSCGDDDVREKNVMQEYYAESLNLDLQTTDSIQRFATKVNGYVQLHPEAKSSPYYPQITSELHNVVITLTTENWGEDVHVLLDNTYSSAPQM